MKKWLTSLFLLFALAGGVVAGMPLHSENNRMMICCKKAKSKEQTSEASIARLCCAMNCTNSVPTSSGVSFNFSPSSVIISDSVIEQIALLLQRERPVSTISISLEREFLPQKSPPKYIQHHSFLI